MAEENLGLSVLRGDLTAARAKLQADIEHKMAVRDQIDALINSLAGAGAEGRAEAETETAAQTAASTARTRAPQRAAPPRRRARRPRGMITNKVREFLQRQTDAVHATRILAFLESEGAAPQSEKPMPTLQSTLQRMKENGEVRNTGRNRWELVRRSESSAEPAAPAPAAVSSEAEAPAAAAEVSAPAAASESNTGEREGDPPRIASTTSFSSFSDA